LNRLEWITHKGRRILAVDFTGLTEPAAALAAIAEVRPVIAAEPLNSVLTLTNITGSTFDPTIVEALKQLTKDDKPYVRAAAVVGVTGLQRIVMSLVSVFSGRSFALFETVDEARDWLAKQP
jgi:hypothetical protein